MRDAPVRLAQQEHRALDSASLEVVVRRFAEDGAKAADEVSLGYVSDGGHRSHVEGLGI